MLMYPGTQAWTGAMLVRYFKLDDDKLIIKIAPTKYGLDGVMQKSTLTLRRV
jgi:hypothetical protein